ncbi:F-box/WD repeat-containing protein 12 [Dasypus novemcinctus]|uniref:F-box/WD repeat-containing protein 12 n=1 Tax=Dasypus novemcinctus TaxID=9361 RepID=UPI00032897CD|nr:F-box/WD repeat-containing protein 12 [Dasypus novemcinctus]
MELQLPDLPLQRIFSFLDPFTLLSVSQVSKQWHHVAENDNMWRWSSCSLAFECRGTQTWKQFFLSQAKEEYRMALARLEDFNYKEVFRNHGILGPMAYLSGTSPTMDGQGRSIICTVSSKRRLCAWDVQVGNMIWSSPVQRTRITNVATLPQMGLAFTVDLEGTVKVWNCGAGDALAAFTVSKACFSLEAFLSKDGPFLMVGNSEGDIYTLTVPELRYVSKVNAFRYSVDLLVISPEKKWIFVSGNHQHILPKVYFAECLLRPSEGETPLSQALSFANCCRACWTPRKKNRVIMMVRKGSNKKTGFITFDIATERTGGRTVLKAMQMASFLLPDHMEPPIWMGAHDQCIIVFESGPTLFLFSINGHQLRRLDNHQTTISTLWVDSVHVLTTSMDDSMHLYQWEEEGRYPYVKSCCHLDFMSPDQAPSW